MKKILFLIASVLVLQLADAQDTTRLQTNVKMYPVLWQQSAAEYRALCYQAFNTAMLRLNEIPKKKWRKEKLAIVTDLDETILDNSYSDAQLIKNSKEYSSQLWNNWVSLSAATSVPGAVEFLQYAKQKGVAIFYISNRDTSQVSSTITNLQKLQLPDADTAHTLFLSNTSSKEIRRQKVAQQYNIVMLLGDNLNDFTQAFEKKSIAERFIETDKIKEEWGKKFIVLPNASYGEWENALYNYQHNLNTAQKREILMTLLKGY